MDPASPEAIGEAVFADFVARMDRQPFKSEDEAQAALDAALADERLVNLEARAFFEWRVACRLVEGWQPGHEFLLGPACSGFHWDTERRQLAVFGRVGAILNAAIDERLIFYRQSAEDFESQRRLIQRLRLTEAPPPAQLAQDVPRLRMLAQRYPHWLPIITSRSNLQAIIDRVRGKYPYVKIMIAGMQMPTSMGPDYTRNFAAMYPELAQANQATLIPFLLEGVGGIPSMNLGDQIHPNVEGHRRVAETVWKHLQPLL